METIHIICVDDQPEVLDSVVRDLRALSPHVRLDEAGDAAECRELMEQIDDDGEHLALVISDHMMPGATGVELLSGIAADRRFAFTRKMLLTGLASHRDTIEAINDGHIDYYVEKPWQAEKLLAVVKRLLTLYVLDADLELEPLAPVLDQQVIANRLHTPQSDTSSFSSVD